MSTFKTIASTLSVTLVFFGIILMLVPESKMKKPFVSFASVVLVTCVIASFSMADKAVENIDLNLMSDLSYFESITEIGNRTELNAVKDAVIKVVKDELDKQGIQYYEVSVTTDILEDTSISISEVLVSCSNKDQEKCENILRNLDLNGRVTVN